MFFQCFQFPFGIVKSPCQLSLGYSLSAHRVVSADLPQETTNAALQMEHSIGRFCSHSYSLAAH